MALKQLKNSAVAPDGSQYITLTDGNGNLIDPSTLGGGGGNNPPGTPTTILNIFSYLSPSQLASVKARDGAADTTTAWIAMAAAIPTTGAKLVIPAGRYVMTGGITLANPFSMVGEGCGDPHGNPGITQIECNTNGVAAFTVTAPNGFFDGFNIKYTGGTTAASGSRAIFTNGLLDQRVCYGNQLSIDGFYDSIDQGTGEGCTFNGILIINSVHWGIRMRNTANADAGDNRIYNCSIYPAANADAGIRYESGGGLTITQTKIVPNAGNCVNGISVATTGTSSQLTIAECNIEGTSAECILIDFTNWTGLLISGCYLRTVSVTASAIKISNGTRITISANVLTGNSGNQTAMTLISCGGVVLLSQRTAGWGNGNLTSSLTTLLVNNLEADFYYDPNAISITSGTYSNDAAGTITLTMPLATTVLIGQMVNLSGLTGTGAVASLNGNWPVNAGSTGVTIAVKGPASAGAATITGGVFTYNIGRIYDNVTAAGNFGGSAPIIMRSYAAYGSTQSSNVTKPLYMMGGHVTADGCIAGHGTTDTWMLGSTTTDTTLTGTAATWDKNNNFAVGNGVALVTSATNGFIYTPSCAGVPSGIPGTAYTGSIPFVYDSTNNILNAREIGNNAWIPVDGELASAKVDGGTFTSNTAATIIPAAARFTIPANYLQVGKVLKMTATGRLTTTTATPGNLSFRLMLGPTSNIIAFDSGTFALNTTASTTQAIWIEILYTVRAIGATTSANGIGTCRVTSLGVGTGAVVGTVVGPNPPVVGTGFDSTVANIVDLFGLFGTNATNTLILHEYVLEALT